MEVSLNCNPCFNNIDFQQRLIKDFSFYQWKSFLVGNWILFCSNLSMLLWLLHKGRWFEVLLGTPTPSPVSRTIKRLNLHSYNCAQKIILQHAPFWAFLLLKGAWLCRYSPWENDKRLNCHVQYIIQWHIKLIQIIHLSNRFILAITETPSHAHRFLFGWWATHVICCQLCPSPCQHPRHTCHFTRSR